MGHGIRLYKKDDVLFRVPFLPEKEYFEPEKIQFSPIIESRVIVVTFKLIPQSARNKGFVVQNK